MPVYIGYKYTMCKQIKLSIPGLKCVSRTAGRADIRNIINDVFYSYVDKNEPRHEKMNKKTKHSFSLYRDGILKQ